MACPQNKSLSLKYIVKALSEKAIILSNVIFCTNSFSERGSSQSFKISSLRIEYNAIEHHTDLLSFYRLKLSSELYLRYTACITPLSNKACQNATIL